MQKPIYGYYEDVAGTRTHIFCHDSEDKAMPIFDGLFMTDWIRVLLEEMETDE